MNTLTLEGKVHLARDVVRRALREQLESSVGNLSDATLDSTAGELLESVTRPSLRTALQVLSICDDELHDS